jgi:dTMP kinase
VLSSFLSLETLGGWLQKLMNERVAKSGKRRKGLLLSFEGIDASGKNTQSSMLVHFLRSKGIPCEFLSFPVYETIIGQEISSFLSGKKNYNSEARQLLYAANRYEFKDKIENWLNDEKIVVINRYCESNIAYGVANGLPAEWIRNAESLMPRADYIFYLKATTKLSTLRKTERDKYESNLQFLSRVTEVYDAIFEKGRWFAIDAEGSIESIHREISSLAMTLIE